MLVVGLTGGIASGKTVVSKMLRDLGAFIIDADETSREVVAPHKKCWGELIAHFGKDILGKDLTVDRKKLADRVFNNPEQLSKLNSLIHPEIMKRIDEKLEEIRNENPEAIVVIDAALLVETGMHKKYDKLIVVYATVETQRKRLMTRNGISKDEAQKRINFQLPIKEKAKLADFLIENEDSLKKTEEQVKKVFTTLSSLKSFS